MNSYRMWLEESYLDGERIERDSSDATWDVVAVAWGWDAIPCREYFTGGHLRKNFPKFDQAEAYAIEHSKTESEVA